MWALKHGAFVFFTAVLGGARAPWDWSTSHAGPGFWSTCRRAGMRVYNHRKPQFVRALQETPSPAPGRQSAMLTCSCVYVVTVVLRYRYPTQPLCLGKGNSLGLLAHFLVRSGTGQLHEHIISMFQSRKKLWATRDRHCLPPVIRSVLNPGITCCSTSRNGTN